MCNIRELELKFNSGRHKLRGREREKRHHKLNKNSFAFPCAATYASFYSSSMDCHKPSLVVSVCVCWFHFIPGSISKKPVAKYKNIPIQNNISKHTNLLSPSVPYIVLVCRNSS
jgi:hypothetical protein